MIPRLLKILIVTICAGGIACTPKTCDQCTTPKPHGKPACSTCSTPVAPTCSTCKKHEAAPSCKTCSSHEASCKTGLFGSLKGAFGCKGGCGAEPAKAGCSNCAKEKVHHAAPACSTCGKAAPVVAKKSCGVDCSIRGLLDQFCGSCSLNKEKEGGCKSCGHAKEAKCSTCGPTNGSTGTHSHTASVPAGPKVAALPTKAPTMMPNALSPSITKELPTSSDHTSQKLSTESVPATPDHAKDYSWIVGQLEYLNMKKQWRVRYAPCDVDDAFGGVVTLSGVDHLSEQLKDGMYVKLQGQLVNPDQTKAAPDYFVYGIGRIVEVQK